MSTCCPCDKTKHPVKPDIPAGQTTLPRQLAGFPEYRLAMLRDIPTYGPLAGWRARAGNDLGIMLLEMWAYVLDIVGFYDERLANESFLRTAFLRPSLRKLTGLIGYLPRPALAASAELAAIAEGVKEVKLPPRTGFRSDAFDSEAPQVFETEVEHTIHPVKNQWTLGPVRDKFPGDDLFFETGGGAIEKGRIVLFRWTNGGAEETLAGRIGEVSPIKALDGETYLKVELSPAPALDPAVELSAVEVLSPSVTALPSLYAATPVSNSTGITLDALYSGLAQGDAMVVQNGEDLRGALITDVFRENVTVATIPDGQGSVDAITPANRIIIDDTLPSSWVNNPDQLIIHLRMIDAGNLTLPARTHLDTTVFTPSGVALDGTVLPLPEGVTESDRYFLQDADDNGVIVDGTVRIAPDGAGSASLADSVKPFDPLLRAPVEVFGNVVKATRGESVFNEVLGAGDAAQKYQSFKLKNKPLTYLNDASAPNGRRGTLEVRVNGVLWKEKSSLFGAGPQDQVYIVRQNDDQESIVTFGDGIRGARLPSGVDNVVATYRYGAGAAKPPSGGIGQLARSVPGLRRVVNPVAAGGGADADQPKDLRQNAPASALLLGRAVSPPDFEALAREYGGVRNAHVEWAWDETLQGAVVKVWFISDGGDIASGLRSFLIGQADPNTPLVAVEADDDPSDLIIDLEIDERFNPDLVTGQVAEALTNPETGILALENIPIGCPLFRSALFEAVLGVEGVISVREMSVDGDSAPFAITVEQGFYRAFLDTLLVRVTATSAGSLSRAEVVVEITS